MADLGGGEPHGVPRSTACATQEPYPLHYLSGPHNLVLIGHTQCSGDHYCRKTVHIRLVLAAHLPPWTPAVSKAGESGEACRPEETQVTCRKVGLQGLGCCCGPAQHSTEATLSLSSLPPSGNRRGWAGCLARPSPCPALVWGGSLFACSVQHYMLGRGLPERLKAVGCGLTQDKAWVSDPSVTIVQSLAS